MSIIDLKIRRHFLHTLKHLYINPLEKCNLRCKICYTRKTAPILSQSEIETFIARYRQEVKLETITFCGGEVFALNYFPDLMNTLTQQGMFVQVITNGTIDKLEELTTPNLINLIVSLDGLPAYHDKNRGQGNFAKSLAFLQKAHRLGFHTEVFSIVTHQNLSQIDQFETYLEQQLQHPINITYHPRKPPTYLLHHPVSNIVGETDGFDFLNKEEMVEIMSTRQVFPPKDLGCYQIALVSDGRVFGCCEGVNPIGTMTDEISHLLQKLENRIAEWEQSKSMTTCLGCSDHEFMCGIKEYLPIVQKKTSASVKAL